ncbi:hypothetical protein EES42_42935 [Streptomyces sp. ADI95-17]|nr:hypothetical protein EES42_42935 [Streptomyces sp. ADI95-17]
MTTPSPLDPYLDYLQQRWDEGQHSAKTLHEELRTKGYLGHYQRVKMVAPLRRRELPQRAGSASGSSPGAEIGPGSLVSVSNGGASSVHFIEVIVV